MLVTRDSPDPGETQAGLAGLEISADQGLLDQLVREGTLAVLAPGDFKA